MKDEKNNQIDNMKSEQHYLTVTNTFIETIHRMGINEKKILNSIAHHIRKDPFPDNTDYYFTVSDLSKILNVENVYEAVDNATKNLSDVEFGIRDPESKTFDFCRLLSRRGYGNGILHLQITDGFKYIFTNLEKGYTRLKITCIRNLKSFYSIRLYEILKENLYRQTFEITLSDLRKYLKCENKLSLYANFRIKVLDRAMQEISEISDITVSYRKVRKNIKGEKETFIVFDIAPNEKNISDIIELPGMEFNPADIDQLEVELFEYGFRGDFGKLVRMIGYDSIKWYWEQELKDEVKKAEGKNHGGLIVKKLKKNAKRSHLLHLMKENKEQQILKNIDRQTKDYNENHSQAEFVFEFGFFLSSLPVDQVDIIRKEFRPSSKVGDFSMDILEKFFNWHNRYHIHEENEKVEDSVKRWILNVEKEKLAETARKMDIVVRNVYMKGVNTDDGEDVRKAALENCTLGGLLAVEAGIVS